MSDEELKQECKNWALAYKEKTGKFPISEVWKIKNHPDNPPPCGKKKVSNLFDTYNNFRESCGERPLFKTFPTLKEAFEDQLANKIVTESGCWESFNLIPQGQGYVRMNWTPISAHRAKGFGLHIVSYFYHKDGDVTLESYENRDLDLKVRHMCAKKSGENKECFNPDHLKLGTTADNSNDARSYHAGYKAKENVFEILVEHDENMEAEMTREHSIEVLALKYGVSTSTVRRIVKGETYNDTPGRDQYEAEKNKRTSTS